MIRSRPLIGGQKWTPKVAVKSGPKKWRSKKDPKSGGQKWTPKVAAKSGPQKWLPKVDPKSGGKKGPQKWRPKVDPKSGGLCATIRIGREIRCLPYAGFKKNYICFAFKFMHDWRAVTKTVYLAPRYQGHSLSVQSYEFYLHAIIFL